MILLVVLPLLSRAQLWEHYYGQPDNYNSSRTSFETYDKGILTAGNIGTVIEDRRTWLIKLDRNGDSLWSKRLSSNYNNGMFGITGTLDGGIALAGREYVYGNYVSPIPLVVKLDACGELDWCTYFETERLLPRAQSIQLADEGGYLIVLNQFGDYDFENTFLVKLDAFGLPVWAKPVIDPETHPDSRVPMSESLLKTNEGGFLVTGDVYWRENPDDTVFWLRPFYAMFDAEGNEQWVTPFGVGDSLLGRGYSCIKMDNGNFICAARQLFRGNSLQRGFIIELDNQGNVLQYKSIGCESIGEDCESIFFQHIEQFGDSLVLTMPYLPDHLQEGYPSIITLGIDLFDEEVTVHALRKFIDKISPSHHILETSDNKLYLAMIHIHGPNNLSDIYLIKMDSMLQTDSISPDNSTYDSLCPQPINYSDVLLSNCHVVTNLQELWERTDRSDSNHFAFSIHPNPAGDRIYLRLDKQVVDRKVEVYVYNSHGRLMLQPVSYHFSDNGIDVSSLPAGFYIVQLFHKGNSLGTQKLIKL